MHSANTHACASLRQVYGISHPPHRPPRLFYNCNLVVCPGLLRQIPTFLHSHSGLSSNSSLHSSHIGICQHIHTDMLAHCAPSSVCRQTLRTSHHLGSGLRASRSVNGLYLAKETYYRFHSRTTQSAVVQALHGPLHGAPLRSKRAVLGGFFGGILLSMGFQSRYVAAAATDEIAKVHLPPLRTMIRNVTTNALFHR
jgi:hypothetical protein